MGTGWLTCIPAVLLPHSLCRCATVNAPANRQMPIASVVMAYSKKRKKTDLLAEKSLTNCPLSVGLYEFSVWQNLLDFEVLLSGQFLADFKGKNWTFSFYDYKPERLKSWKLRFNNTKTEFQTLLVSELKSVFDSWKRKRNEKKNVLVDFVR